MLKVGELFITRGGFIAKIISEFGYGDGYKWLGAIWTGGNWRPARLNDAGQSSEDSAFNHLGSINDWIKLYHFSIMFDSDRKTWTVTGTHKRDGVMSVTITSPGNPETLLLEAKKAAYDKMLDYVRPLGYELKYED